jgi:hypothetical protein
MARALLVRSSGVSFALAIALATLAPSAHAKPPSQSSSSAAAAAWSAPTSPLADVDAAELLYSKLDYEGANAAASRALVKRGLSHDALLRATRILAITHADLEHEDASRDAFVLLLAYEPDFQLDPNLGPKVSAPFFEARGFWRGRSGKPGIETSAITHGTEGATIRVTLRDSSHLAKRIVIAHRWGGQGDLLTKQVAAGDTSIEIERPPPGVGRLDYYAQALDDHDDVVFESGNAHLPKSAMLDMTALADRGAEKSKSFIGSAGFWIGAGAIVVAGAATAILLARSTQSGTPTSATLTPSLQCGVGIKCN